MSRVVVVGGGLTGLAAAYELGLRGGAEVVVVEAAGRLGGKIETRPFAGLSVETGPDAFLARVPWAVDLCRELGLGEELVSPAEQSAYLWVRGALRRLPADHVLGVPVDVDQLAATGLVSDEGVAIARRDLDRPAGPPEPGTAGADGDVSVGELIRTRMGDEVLEHLVGPLIGGINAGDADRLSLEASAPQIAAAARRDASLVRGLRALRAESPPDPDAPVFYTLAGGLQRLVERLAEVMTADVRLDTEVTGLDRGPGGGYSVATSAGVIEADAVVLTGPAWLSARLTEGLATDAAATLAAVEYSSVALVALAVAPEAISRPLDASGFLVPRTEDRLITACTWNSRKWAHLDRPGQVLLRASAGRFGDERIADLGDEELVEAVRADLHTTMGLDAAPLATRVTRWRDSFPQYLPGHLERVAAVEAALAADAPGVLVAGAAQRGVGIPACIRQGREAATVALAHLGSD